MNKQQTNQVFCETLKSLIVQLPVKRGFSLKQASQLTGVDLYKYRHDGISPMTLSLKSFCDAFQIDPGWLIRLADEVAAERLTEDRALEILHRWPQVKNRFDTASKVAIDETIRELSV